MPSTTDRSRSQHTHSGSARAASPVHPNAACIIFDHSSHKVCYWKKRIGPRAPMPRHQGRSIHHCAPYSADRGFFSAPSKLTAVSSVRSSNRASTLTDCLRTYISATASVQGILLRSRNLLGWFVPCHRSTPYSVNQIAWIRVSQPAVPPRVRHQIRS